MNPPFPSVDTTDSQQHVEDFKSPHLIWLYDSSADNTLIEKKFGSISIPCAKFQDVTLCHEYIDKLPRHHRVLMIISHCLEEKLLSLIDQFQQMTVICTDGSNYKTKDEWAQECSKTQVIPFDRFVPTMRLYFRICQEAEGLPSSDTFMISAGNSTGEVRGRFVFFQALIDCLQRMVPDKPDEDELISFLRKTYEGNKEMLRLLRIFHNYYSPEKAIRWYTSEPFFYDTINTALRQQDIHTMFLWRSFLFDIYKQLEKSQLKHRKTVYRGQRISKVELETLRNSIGQLISVNSFWSTSEDRQMAVFFAESNGVFSNMVAVLFEIEAEPLLVDKKPFADIVEYSQFPDEHEILFMFGSIFRVGDVKQETESMWIIKLNLCDDDDEDLQEILKYMQEQNGKGKTDLRTLGKLMSKMGDYELAEKYYRRFLDELPPNDILRPSIYKEIALIKSQNHEFNDSIEWQRKALKLTEKSGAADSESSSTRTVHPYARWAMHAITVAGGGGLGKEMNQLYLPEGVTVDYDGTIYIADWQNHRIVVLKDGEKEGYAIHGDTRNKNESEKLLGPSHIVNDKENNCLIVSDNGNRRIIRLFHQNGVIRTETLLENTCAWGLAMDDEGSLYVTDLEKHEVRRYRRGEMMRTGTIVAGGNGQGHGREQLNMPLYIFVDSTRTVYVSDHENHRVMEWKEGAKEGTLVAGGQRNGHDLAHLWSPSGVLVDKSGNIYVADSQNHRVLRWRKGAKQGELIAGGHKPGEKSNQLDEPKGISFDRHNNLYVVDKNNHRVQRFNIY